MAVRLAKAESTITEIGVPAAMVIWLVWLAMSLWRRKLDAGFVITSALIAAILSRVVLLGFLEATSIPSNNMLYLSSVAPMTLALIPTALFGVIASARMSGRSAA